MKTNVVNLRSKMNEIIQALDRNENVTLLYHGKEKAAIIPLNGKKSNCKVSEHPFFSMYQSETEKSVGEMMQDLRGGRYNVD